MRVNFLLFFAKKESKWSFEAAGDGGGRGQHFPTFKMIDLSQHQNGLVDHEYTYHLIHEDTFTISEYSTIQKRLSFKRISKSQI